MPTERPHVRRDGAVVDWLPQPRAPLTQPPVHASAKPVPPPAHRLPPRSRETIPSPPEKAPSRRSRKASEADRTWWPLIVVFVALVLSTALFVAPFAIETPVAPGPPEPKPSPSPTSSQPIAPPSEPAALPDGAPFTPAGAGAWHVVPGVSGSVSGTGTRQLTYTVEIEDGVDFPSFAPEVETILSDPRGWITSDDVSLRRIDDLDASPSFRISLTSPTTSRRPDLCGFEIPYDSSCYLTHDHRVVVNLARWVRGAHSYEDDLLGYHRYAVNHEVGHALGHGHVGCPAPGAVAPVMMQQTFGLSNSYVANLNRAEPGAAVNVRSDGAVCRPNPWVTTAR
ncbi:DUF3152 domain-containing protein [Amycolatopsis sp. NPDC051071]|uniref:DUF3152 domain-containing protein n=1 Tax=Amycolatopsis sp. NPDC051071 TaxID=3154637 RepID=UPI0034354DB3